MSSNFTACPIFVPTEAELNVKEGSGNKIIISCMIKLILTDLLRQFYEIVQFGVPTGGYAESAECVERPHETFLLKEIAGESILTGRS